MSNEHWHQVLVSIHAPREGRDLVRQGAAQAARGFQSTRPVKGATRNNLNMN